MTISDKETEEAERADADKLRKRMLSMALTDNNVGAALVFAILHVGLAIEDKLWDIEITMREDD